MREILGFKKGEVPEDSMELINKMIHPDDISNFYYQEDIQKWEDSYVNKYEYRLKNADDKWKWFSGREKEFKRKNGHIESVIGVVSDITEFKEYEAKLLLQKNQIKLSNERLESLLRISQLHTNSVQELLDFALEEAIKLTNSKIGYIYFYDEKKRQFILNTWSKNVMNDCTVINPQSTYDLDKTGIWGEAVRQEKPIVLNDFDLPNPLKRGTPEGHIKLTKFLTVPVFIDKKIVAVAGVANKETDYDNSDVRQLSLLMDSVWKISERILLIKDLEIAKQKAEESDRLKTAFLQNISHEIRTPLNAICGFSGLLDDEELSENKRKSFTSIILNSSNQLLSIVSDILTISSLETKQEKVNISSFNINDIIIELLAVYRQQAQKQNIIIYAKQFFTNKQAKILSDKTKLIQILTNLLSNSLKFTHEGFIEFGYSLENNELIFYVKDTGIGISSEAQQIIFERFNQANLSIQQNYGGTGLGLAISKGFVELLGGKIWVNSEVNKGSTFYFSIPYNSDNKSDEIKEEMQKDNKIYTVLIAEDEEFNYLYIEELLIDLNIKLIHAKNGKEAVEICSQNQDIVLVMMDIKMPIMDGYTAAKLIKKSNPQLPIIAQSAYALEHEIEKFNDIFDNYLPKPINSKQLIDAVSVYLDLK